MLVVFGWVGVVVLGGWEVGGVDLTDSVLTGDAVVVVGGLDCGGDEVEVELAGLFVEVVGVCVAVALLGTVWPRPIGVDGVVEATWRMRWKTAEKIRN